MTLEAFQESGYFVQAPGRIQGTSGVTHEVDILCHKHERKVLVDIRGELDVVGAIPVISLYTKMFDTGCLDAVLVAVPEACELARELSQLYGVKIIESRDPQQVAISVKNLFQHSSPLKVPVHSGDVNSSRLQVIYSKKVRLRFIKSALDILTLLSLKQSSVTGYEMMSGIYSKFGILLSPGTIYPVFKRLEKEGLVSAVEEGRKRLYSITQAGDLVLKVAIEEYETIQTEILAHLHSLSRISIRTD